MLQRGQTDQVQLCPLFIYSQCCTSMLVWEREGHFLVENIFNESFSFMSGPPIGEGLVEMDMIKMCL